MRPPAGIQGRVFWARGVRDFGDGLAAVLLLAYLVALGYGATEIGLVAMAARHWQVDGLWSEWPSRGSLTG